MGEEQAKIPEFYINAVRVSMTLYDMLLDCGLMLPPSGASEALEMGEVRPVVHVRMSMQVGTVVETWAPGVFEVEFGSRIRRR